MKTGAADSGLHQENKAGSPLDFVASIGTGPISKRNNAGELRYLGGRINPPRRRVPPRRTCESKLQGVGRVIERRKVIRHCFRAANEFDRAVAAQQKFLGAEAAVILEAHGQTMCTGIVNSEKVAFPDRR